MDQIPPDPRLVQAKEDHIPTFHSLLPNHTVNHGIDPASPTPCPSNSRHTMSLHHGRVGLPLKGFLISVWYHQPLQHLTECTVNQIFHISEPFSPRTFLYVTTQQIKSKGSFKVSEKECEINIAHKSVASCGSTFHCTFTGEQNSLFQLSITRLASVYQPQITCIITTQLLPPLLLSFKYNYSFPLWQTRYKCFYSSND